MAGFVRGFEDQVPWKNNRRTEARAAIASVAMNIVKNVNRHLFLRSPPHLVHVLLTAERVHHRNRRRGTAGPLEERVRHGREKMPEAYAPEPTPRNI